MDFLPEHPQTWADYADEITQARKWKRSAALTTRDKVKHQRSQRRRRDYQRNYMRDYRARLRSGSL
jgi:hypothetical protein